MREINVYVKEITTTVDGIEKQFIVHSSTQKSKDNPNEFISFDVKPTKRCTKKLPSYNCVIGFEVSKSYYIADRHTSKNGKEYIKRVLYLDDFEIIREIPKKVTTEEDLPF